jgi:Na+/H+-dicarboxylate symporter
MKNSAVLFVFVAMVFGAIAGRLTQDIPLAIEIYSLIGTLFLNALTLVVVPLVASSLIIGTSRLGEDEKMGRLGAATFVVFLSTAFLAVLVGMASSLWIDSAEIYPTSFENDLGAIVESPFEKIKGVLFRLIPANILAVASQGQMLGLILFSVVFGFFSSRIDEEPGRVVRSFFRGVFLIMMKGTHLVMKALPLGVFALIAKVAATTGFQAMYSVALFFGTALAALALFIFVILPLLLWMFGISPLKHFQAIFPALVTAFSTSSTAATLPITIECMEKRGGIPNRVCSFVLPLGTTVNLAGTALYCVAAVIFIGKGVGVSFTTANLLVIGLMGMFSSLGMVAGIPSASLVTIVVILQSLGISAEAVALILPVERILDMCRSTVNVYTNSFSSALVNRLL